VSEGGGKKGGRGKKKERKRELRRGGCGARDAVPFSFRKEEKGRKEKRGIRELL